MTTTYSLARKLSLPPWDPSLSDGCSIPSWLKWLFPPDKAAREVCCLQHDRLYYYGGTEEQRRDADDALYECWIRTGVPMWLSYSAWLVVRAWGAPYWGRASFWRNRRAWGWGGAKFRYDRRVK